MSGVTRNKVQRAIQEQTYTCSKLQIPCVVRVQKAELSKGCSWEAASPHRCAEPFPRDDQLEQSRCAPGGLQPPGPGSASGKQSQEREGLGQPLRFMEKSLQPATPASFLLPSCTSLGKVTHSGPWFLVGTLIQSWGTRGTDEKKIPAPATPGTGMNAQLYHLPHAV